MYEQLSNQKFGISTLCQGPEMSLQLLCDHLALRQVTIFDRSLHHSDGVVLEHEICEVAS